MKYYSEFDLMKPENFRFVTEFDETGTGIGYNAIPIDIIHNIPSSDVVEIVYCKDCKNYRSSPFGHPSIGWCMIFGRHFKQTFYCAQGDKRDDKKV